MSTDPVPAGFLTWVQLPDEPSGVPTQQDIDRRIESYADRADYLSAAVLARRVLVRELGELGASHIETRLTMRALAHLLDLSGRDTADDAGALRAMAAAGAAAPPSKNV